MARSHSFFTVIQVLKRSVLIVAMLASPTLCSAINPVDSLRRELKLQHTPADSLPVLLNLYDAIHFSERGKILDKVYNTAKRAGNDQVVAESLFLMAAFYESDKTKEPELMKMADAIYNVDIRNRIKLYIKVRYFANEVRSLPEDKRRTQLLETLAKYKETLNLENYDRMEYLFCLCSYMKNMTDSDLLISYLLELQELIEKLPEDELPLRALFYTQAAICFFNNGLYEEAVAAYQNMLDVNGKFDKRHESQGRIFRNYAGSTYRCLYGMLMCYEVLSD